MAKEPGRTSRFARLADVRRSRLGIAALSLGVVAALCVAMVATAGSPVTESTARCSSDRPLQVIAAPQVAAAVVAVLELAPSANVDSSCPKPVVRAEAPASTVATMAADTADRPDVWIPDSSMWTMPPLDPGARLPRDNPSIASSPFVLAVPATAVQGPGEGPLTVADLLGTNQPSSAPVRWVLPDPTRSAGTVAAFLALRSTLDGRAGGTATLESTVRAADQNAGDLAAIADQGGAARAVPVTEQELLSRVAADPDSGLLPVYGQALALTADFPFIVLAVERDRRLQAGALLGVLQGELGRRVLTARGFRDPSGVPGAALTSQPGFEPGASAVRVPVVGDVQRAVSGLDAIRRSTRVLAVIDVSGSMKRSAPGVQQGSRLDLALQGLVAGLAVYPDDTIAGLWTFASKLTTTTDHRELVPMIGLGRAPDGTLGRTRLAQGLARVTREPHGGTALYETVLAAVRAVRAEWDADRVNSVVILTDGANADPDGIKLRTLLRRLRDEQKTGRPVAVFAVGYGPTADHKALEAIADASGGVAYRTRDPRRIGALIADAIGRRGTQDAGEG